MRFVDVRRRSSQTTVGVLLLYWQHRSVRGKPYIFSVNPRRRTVVWRFFAARSLAGAFSRTSPPLRSRPGVASVILESLVSRRRCSREEFTNNRSAQLLFIYIDTQIHHSSVKTSKVVVYILIMTPHVADL